MEDVPHYRDAHINVHVWQEGEDLELRARVRFTGVSSPDKVLYGRTEISGYFDRALVEIEGHLRR